MAEKEKCPVCESATFMGECLLCLKRERRGFQLMARNMAAFISLDAPGTVDFGRAGGDVICQKCGQPYIEHPTVTDDCLHLLCDGKKVKL